jgi:hypothetical protein
MPYQSLAPRRVRSRQGLAYLRALSLGLPPRRARTSDAVALSLLHISAKEEGGGTGAPARIAEDLSTQHPSLSARSARFGRVANGMNNRQEVQVRTGALTEGTRHRGDKGVDLELQVLAKGVAMAGPRGEVWWKS